MLIGLAAKNAILIVEFAKMEYDRANRWLTPLSKAPPATSAHSDDRFAFILGCVPLAKASGAGGALAPGHGLRRDRRHAGRELHRHLPDPGDLLRGGATRAPRWQTRGTCSSGTGITGFRGRALAMERLLKQTVLLTLLAWMATGCAVGPNFQRPAVNTPDQFRSGPTVADQPSFADLPWWQIFHEGSAVSVSHFPGEGGTLPQPISNRRSWISTRTLPSHTESFRIR